MAACRALSGRSAERVVLHMGDEQAAREVDEMLWHYPDKRFVPHSLQDAPLPDMIADIMGSPEVDCAVDCVGFEARGHGQEATVERPPDLSVSSHAPASLPPHRTRRSRNSTIGPSSR